MSQPITRVQTRKDFLLQKLDGKMSILFHLEGEHYYGLNPVGVLSWETLQKTDSFDEVIQEVHSVFTDVSAETIRQDLTDLVHQLEKADLATIA